MAGDDRVFESSGGPLQLRAVSMEAVNALRRRVERELREAGLPLDPPYYEAETVAGTKELHAHSEETLETDEDRAAWEAYQQARQMLDREAGQRTIRYMLAEGVILDGPDQAWLDRMARLGLELSDDPLERREQYISFEFTRTPREILALVQRIMTLSAEGSRELEEAVAELDGFFRGDMEGAAAGSGDA